MLEPNIDGGNLDDMYKEALDGYRDATDAITRGMMWERVSYLYRVIAGKPLPEAFMQPPLDNKPTYSQFREYIEKAYQAQTATWSGYPIYPMQTTTWTTDYSQSNTNSTYNSCYTYSALQLLQTNIQTYSYDYTCILNAIDRIVYALNRAFFANTSAMIYPTWGARGLIKITKVMLNSPMKVDIELYRQIYNGDLVWSVGRLDFFGAKVSEDFILETAQPDFLKNLLNVQQYPAPNKEPQQVKSPTRLTRQISI